MLALVSAIEVSVLALRVAGVNARLWAGPFLVSIHSVYKPLSVALWRGGGAAGRRPEYPRVASRGTRRHIRGAVLEPPAGTAKPVTVLQAEPVYVEAFRVER